MVYVADFETINNVNDCRVWLWGLYNIENDKFFHGNTIETFFEKILSLKGKSKIYFHNLKFDGEFLFYYLFRNGWIHTREKVTDKTFSSVINHMGQFYSIVIGTKKKTISILDSLKIIPLKVSQISKAFGVDMLKGSIDYNKKRSKEYIPTDEEIEYVKNDVMIVAAAIRYFQDQNLKKMTTSSNALKNFKDIISKNNFDRWFVMDLKTDQYIRKSYKGGFTWVNPKIQGKTVKEGLVYDVNSLYPSVMYNEKLPYGEGIYFKGKYEKTKFYDVYIQRFICNFAIKKDHIPTLQVKHHLFFSSTDYLTSSEGLDVELTLTSVDLELFLKHYNVYNIEYIDGFKYKSTDKLFKNYIDKWIDIKIKASVSKNQGMRTIAKLMLNSLYGKFASNPELKSKFPEYDSYNDFINYNTSEVEYKEPIYVPVASFITSYARRITIESAQKNYHRFLYADTDSLHLSGWEEPTNIEIDENKLGAWKLEGKFTKAKFLRAKCYIEEIDSKIKVTVAGLPEESHNVINFMNFKAGLKIENKLQHKRVSGGVVLQNIDYSLKL